MHFQDFKGVDIFADRFLKSFLVSGDFVASFASTLSLSQAEKGVLTYYFLQQKLCCFFSRQCDRYQRRFFVKVSVLLTWAQPILFFVLSFFVFLSVYVSFLPMLYSGDLI